eukprot:CAMPEP_0179053824 /NCGR_PEP_ID=MMETSP0796-20121207/22472_1 /TAXON_ID=73915 /ORGANISM="Pyrodinium bahamense, Strain pbaha01" /LENGTH=540 /DNA_ID=CAMNT_0020750433 /DNA_START=81 /DNA_END=1703 /DNA_ORIENTATION=-
MPSGTLGMASIGNVDVGGEVGRRCAVRLAVCQDGNGFIPELGTACQPPDALIQSGASCSGRGDPAHALASSEDGVAFAPPPQAAEPTYVPQASELSEQVEDVGGVAGLTTRPRSPEELVELTIVSMSGSELAVLRCLPWDLVSEVKRRLSRAVGAPASGQRLLVNGRAMLRDRDTLAQCGIAKPGATLHCVYVRPSGVARNLEAQRHSEDPAQAMGACLADIADTVMQSEYALSVSVRPCASNITRAITLRHRAELINWMVQAFDVLHFDDCILHSVVLTLDRYYTRRATPIEVTSIQRVLLSAVCTEMKISSECDFTHGHWQRVLTHLCQGRLSIPTILQAEFEVLSRLDFVVGVPTPVTFLRELGIHLRELASAVNCDRALQLALMLLELALFEPSVQYGCPHAVLAAGALGAALFTLDAPAEQHEALLEDLAVYSPELCKVEELLLDCEEDLLELWLASSLGTGQWADFYQQLERKFSGRSRHGVAFLSPRVGVDRIRTGRAPGARQLRSGAPKVREVCEYVKYPEQQLGSQAVLSF